MFQKVYKDAKGIAWVKNINKKSIGMIEVSIR